MRKFLSLKQSMILLRVVISIPMIVHGTSRWYEGSVGGFGEFLNSFGIGVGLPLAWAITLFEVFGGWLMAAGFFTRWISLLWAFQLLVGIFIVHLPNGWFVVGGGTGGVEYSVVLIAALIAVSAYSREDD